MKDVVPAELFGEPVGTIVFGTSIMRIYRLEEDSQTTVSKFAYRILGIKGANYYLMRNKHKPEMMFALDRKFRKVSRFNDIWFTDSGGEVRVA